MLKKISIFAIIIALITAGIIFMKYDDISLHDYCTQSYEVRTSAFTIEPIINKAYRGNPIYEGIRHPNSFCKFTGTNFGKDKEFVYLLRNPVISDVANFPDREATAIMLENIDIETFQPIKTRYAKDKNGVYIIIPKGLEKLPFDSPKNFKILSSEGTSFDYITDGDSVFIYLFHYNEIRKIGDADLQTFQHIDYRYSKDKNYVFYEEEKLPSANPQKFYTFPKASYYGNDGENVFFHDFLILEADPESIEFFLVKNFLMFLKDKKNIFHCSFYPEMHCDIISGSNGVDYNTFTSDQSEMWDKQGKILRITDTGEVIRK